MWMMAATRLEALRALVEQNPTDSRTRYMLAMQLAGQGDYEEAVRQFEILMAADPDYVAAYQQGGLALEKLGRSGEARTIYLRGIEACRRTGDTHAREELEAALERVGGR